MTYSAVSLDALTGSMLALAFTSVVLRIIARFRMRVKLGADDWLNVAAFVFFIGVAVVMFEFVHVKALGDLSLSPEQQVDRVSSKKGGQLQVALLYLDVFCLACSKASACFLYLRIFVVYGVRNSLFGKVVFGSLVAVALWLIMAVTLVSEICDGRFYALWTLSAYNQYCNHLWDYIYGIMITDVVLDAWILGLPLLPVYQLHTSTIRKVWISGVFLLGAVALGASIARLVIYSQIYRRGVPSIEANGPEVFFSKVFFYFILECGISIIAVNLPVLVPLLLNKSNLELQIKKAASIRSLVSGNGEVSNPEPLKRTDGHGALDPTTAVMKDGNPYGTSEAYAMQPAHSSTENTSGVHAIQVEQTVEVLEDSEKKRSVKE